MNTLTDPLTRSPEDQEILDSRLQEIGQADKVVSYLSMISLVGAGLESQNAQDRQSFTNTLNELQQQNPWEHKVVQALRRQHHNIDVSVDHDLEAQEMDEQLLQLLDQLRAWPEFNPAKAELTRVIKSEIKTTAGIIALDELDKQSIRSGRQGAVSTTEGEE